LIECYIEMHLISATRNLYLVRSTLKRHYFRTLFASKVKMLITREGRNVGIKICLLF